VSTTRELHAELIATVARGLTDLVEQVTFVGGTTIGLYLTDPLAPSPRPTDDVDCIIALEGRKGFYALEKKLRARGFANSTEPGDPICRFVFAGIKVDVMPSDEKILGFSNRWYAEALRRSRKSATLRS
jgi:predicted nucleotidyltransferase